MNHKISVIVPAYNCEAYIRDCLRSIINQTYNNIELIVVDDGSKDSTASIISEFSDKIDVFIKQNNSGVSIARNRGVQESTGEYFTFIDSDDYIEPDYIEKMVDCLRIEDSDLIMCGYNIVNKNGHLEESIIPRMYVQYENEIWAYRLSSAWGRLYKRDYWTKNELTFIEEAGARGEDLPIAMYSSFTAQNIRIVSYAGYNYRQHESSAMHEKNKNGVPFIFPYKSMMNMLKKLEKIDVCNSEDYYKLGWIKILAHFQYVLYVHADSAIKSEFESFASFIFSEYLTNIESIWRRYIFKIDLPIQHKVAMTLLLFRYKKYVK